MSETQSATQDASGVTRAADGTLAPDQTDRSLGTTQQQPQPNQNNQADQNSQATTNQDSKANDNKSLLNQDAGADDKTNVKQDDAGKDDKTTKVVPEKYADYKLPEGYELPAEMKTEIDGMFKDWGLTQEQAQKAVDFYAAKSMEAAEAPMNFYLDTRKGWQDEVKASPDLGPKLSEVKTTIGRAIATLPQDVGQAFKEAMDITGAGDHPAFVRAFYAFAQKVTEGRPVPGRGPSPNGQSPAGTTRPPTTAEAMYPNLPSANR